MDPLRRPVMPTPETTRPAAIAYGLASRDYSAAEQSSD